MHLLTFNLLLCFKSLKYDFNFYSVQYENRVSVEQPAWLNLQNIFYFIYPNNIMKKLYFRRNSIRHFSKWGRKCSCRCAGVIQLFRNCQVLQIPISHLVQCITVTWVHIICVQVLHTSTQYPEIPNGFLHLWLQSLCLLRKKSNIVSSWVGSLASITCLNQ